MPIQNNVLLGKDAESSTIFTFRKLALKISKVKIKMKKKRRVLVIAPNLHGFFFIWYSKTFGYRKKSVPFHRPGPPHHFLLI